MSTPKKSVFEVLSSINVNDHVEKKKDLTYLSWAHAWSEVKKLYPTATYKVGETVEDADLGFMCHTEVTIEGETLAMWLPVMDGANKAMKRTSYEYFGTGWENGKRIQVVKTCEAATMFDINKTIMRCLVKNLAMFGLAIYIYTKDDAPESEKEAVPATPALAATPAKGKGKAKADAPALDTMTKEHPNWGKVVQFVTDNKEADFDALCQQLSRKYALTPAIKKELETIKSNA